MQVQSSTPTTSLTKHVDDVAAARVQDVELQARGARQAQVCAAMS